jgi:hypothetical protein
VVLKQLRSKPRLLDQIPKFRPRSTPSIEALLSVPHRVFTIPSTVGPNSLRFLARKAPSAFHDNIIQPSPPAVRRSRRLSLPNRLFAVTAISVGQQNAPKSWHWICTQVIGLSFSPSPYRLLSSSQHYAFACPGIRVQAQ